ncbi:hypothetical protein TNCT_325641 [Trichonephila clavata]|uniref:Uncharacterized protein n=1 Tax=Trichonephila clavata TaxID=2740835 RepID=A0A8X6LP35_TRICU|nr:hypothetical protein TNCT_325641 [Trichonephila clavata]
MGNHKLQIQVAYFSFFLKTSVTNKRVNIVIKTSSATSNRVNRRRSPKDLRASGLSFHDVHRSNARIFKINTSSSFVPPLLSHLLQIRSTGRNLDGPICVSYFAKRQLVCHLGNIVPNVSSVMDPWSRVEERFVFLYIFLSFAPQIDY